MRIKSNTTTYKFNEQKIDNINKNKNSIYHASKKSLIYRQDHIRECCNYNKKLY